jgi:Spy/CpxP family protein refolding chaperone
MKHIALVAALTLGSAVLVVAEDAAAPVAETAAKVEKDKKIKVAKPYSKIESLSDEQKQQIIEIRKQIAAEMKALKERERTEIAAILTPAQQAELAALEETEAAGKKMKKDKDAPTTAPAAE